MNNIGKLGRRNPQKPKSETGLTYRCRLSEVIRPPLLCLCVSSESPSKLIFGFWSLVLTGSLQSLIAFHKGSVEFSQPQRPLSHLCARWAQALWIENFCQSRLHRIHVKEMLISIMYKKVFCVPVYLERTRLHS